MVKTENKRKVVKIRRRHPPGTAPGQVIAPARGAPPSVQLIAYSATDVVDLHDIELADIAAIREKYSVVWINVVGFGNVEPVLGLGALFGLHRLALEDVINTHQRSKVEGYGDHIFLIGRMLVDPRSVETEQVAIFAGKGFIITFHERSGDCFDPIRQRLVAGKGRIRTEGADYLCYSLIDAIVDAYFPALEEYGERLEELEDAVVNSPERGHISELHDLKRGLLMLRQAIWPHREMINSLIRDPHPLIKVETQPFLRDCYDHTVQMMDMVETYREIASGLLDVYLSSASMRLNEVMKVLTIVATVFMPLSFITSLYGMNFDRAASPWNMPELGWYFGYPFALSLMAGSTASLIWFMWNKGWLGDGRK